MAEIASIVVDIEHSAVDQQYDYLIPKKLADKVKLGVQVVIPFGARKITGFVVDISGETDVPRARLKYIKKVLHYGEKLINEDLLMLAKKIAQYYMAPMASVISCITPAGATGLSRSVRPKTVSVVNLANGIDIDSLNLSNAPKQQAIVAALSSLGEANVPVLLQLVDAPYSSLKALEGKKIVEVFKRQVMRRPDIQSLGQPIQPITELSLRQQAAVKAIITKLDNPSDEIKPILLHGVTGSGKTEVYLQSLEHCLRKGRQGILLVPEIALTPQMTHILHQRFSQQVAVLHSSLSVGERYDEWRRIREGEALIVVGARSAIFAPCENLGLVIIDEEHESTYKQEEGVRYHARMVALWRAKMWKAPLVLGSATPSIESYYLASSNQYELIQMPHRVKHRPLPKVTLVDMRKELKDANKSIFSRHLQQEMSIRLQAKEKIILFLNRRGFSSFVMCRHCGYVCSCDNCDISLTYHASSHRLQCHYCQAMAKVPNLCPSCGSKAIRYFGAGTELVEEETKKLFPDAKIVRMDSDTTTTKGSHHNLLQSFISEADILVGTQMVAKGLDIADVTLVGVVSADTALHVPDFRASERTFQLLTQVAGRAGRGIANGSVVVQTYTPNEYSILAAEHHDYDRFFKKEISVRNKMNYPPFGQLINITCSHRQARVAERAAAFLGDKFNNYDSKAVLLGPAMAPLGKIKQLYRWHLVLKIKETTGIWEMVNSGVQDLRKRATKLKQPLRISVDVDPQSIL